MLEVFDRKELELLKRTLTMWHQDRVLIGAREQAELIKRLIKEIEKKKGSNNEHHRD